MSIRLTLCLALFCAVINGCDIQPAAYTKNDIVKITDFELSPDEEKIAFSAITPIGNLDIWVVNIDGKNLKKLTFQDRSPTNHIARFFKKRRWRNYFEIDMCYPKWIDSGHIAFCQSLTKYEMWGTRLISKRFWVISPDGTGKTSTEPFNTEGIKKPSILSEKLRRTFFIKHNTLWYFDNKDLIPKKLI
ncbi:MAG: hypothetical protein Q8O12_05430 [Candidatus Omnitrophota bacterium]|nr:hypothetical protein [Candidatus Omnitrophota bacterium]